MADEKIIFSMVGVSKTFTNQKKVLNNIYLSFFYGAKIGIIGLNSLFLLSAGLCLAGAGVMVLCVRQYRKQFLQ